MQYEIIYLYEHVYLFFINDTLFIVFCSYVFRWYVLEIFAY